MSHNKFGGAVIDEVRRDPEERNLRLGFYWKAANGVEYSVLLRRAKEH